MRADLGLTALGIISVVMGVRYYENKANAPLPKPTAAAVKPVGSSGALSPYQAGWRKEIRVPAGRDRQFRITAAVNRTPTNFLIDTGAAFVALRESDARRANIYTHQDDYDAPVSTANGVTNAARVFIREIEIEGMRVSNVDAFVLPDDKLGMNLLGMSFLSQIESVEARGGELILRGS